MEARQVDCGAEGAAPTPRFSVSVDSKQDKGPCFDTFVQVLILKELGNGT
jgi:hypothetical protein